MYYNYILLYIKDTSELCRNVHNNNSFKLAAEESFESLSNVIHKLNTDRNIYEKLAQLLNDNNNNNNKLNAEELIFLNDLKNEFESDGINLSEDERE